MPAHTNRIILLITVCAIILFVGLFGYKVYQYVTVRSQANRVVLPRVVISPTDLVFGAADAQSVVYVWSDYTSPSCGQLFKRIVENLVPALDGKIAFVLKDSPTNDSSVASYAASTAARCAAAQGYGKEAAEYLFKTLSEDTTTDAIDRMREAIPALNVGAWNSCRSDTYLQTIIDEERAVGMMYGVRTLPTIYAAGGLQTADSLTVENIKSWFGL